MTRYALWLVAVIHGLAGIGAVVSSLLLTGIILLGDETTDEYRKKTIILVAIFMAVFILFPPLDVFI